MDIKNMSDTLQDMTKKVQEFCEERDWDQYHNPKDLAIGISTEAGELLDIFRFLSEEQSWAVFDDAAKREHAGEEMADVLFFLLRMAERTNMDLAECLDDKIRKNAEKYPVEDVKGKNLKYTEYERL